MLLLEFQIYSDSQEQYSEISLFIEKVSTNSNLLIDNSDCIIALCVIYKDYYTKGGGK